MPEEKPLTVGETIDYLTQFPRDLPLVIHYQLNDWPGDSWGHLHRDAKVATPISITETGSAAPEASQLSLVFSI
jgi:hypothetical protein